jgi:hypothetical protein
MHDWGHERNAESPIFSSILQVINNVLNVAKDIISSSICYLALVIYLNFYKALNYYFALFLYAVLLLHFHLC